METAKQKEQKWSYSSSKDYYLNLSDGSNLFVDFSSGTIGYNDRKEQCVEIAQFDRKTGSVTAEVLSEDCFGTKTEPTRTPLKTLANKDLFIKASGLSKPARTLAHIIFEALEE